MGNGTSSVAHVVRFWWLSGSGYIRVRVKVGLELRLGGTPPFSDVCYQAVV